MKKIVKVTASALAICLLVTGCGNNAELKDNDTVVKTDEGKITADQLYESLRDKYKNIEFHFQDFMAADIDSLNLSSARVIANIPYYITTPIVFKLIDHIEKFKSILILVQKEVAERFASNCGGKEYGITSVILQSIFHVSIPRIVKKECFTPSPKVDSALVKMIPHNKYKISDFEKFKSFIHLCFSMRRKTLINNLKNDYDKEKIISALNENSYPLTVWPEQISVENFIKIFDSLN